jgi:drug/metabolite transporter (DMT)-like permease
VAFGLLFGLLLAFGTAVTTGVASVLQAVAARRASAPDGARARRSGHPAAVGQLVVSPLYLGGTALDALGFVCMVGALHWLPLFLVQCAAAASVGVTAIAGRRVLGTVVHRKHVAGLLGLGVGLVVLAAGAKPEAVPALSREVQIWLLIAAAPLVVGGFLLSRLDGVRAGGALAIAAGLAFAGTGVASRILSNARSVTAVLSAPATYALIVFGVAGMMLFAAALQRTPVTIATAALFGVETITGSAVGLLALGDRTRSGFEAPTAVGFALTLGCAVALALTAEHSVRDEPVRAQLNAG